MYLYLDIETVRGNPPKPLLDNILAGIRPDSRARDKEASIAEKQEKLLAEAALSPMLSQVICVGMASGIGDPFALVSEDERALLEDVYRAIHDPETGLLRQAYDEGDKSGRIVLVTFNGKSFDVPVLLAKYTKYGLKLPFQMLGSKYDTNNHIDVRGILTNYDQYARGTLEQWAAYYGYPEIRTETGGDIQKLYDEKKFKEIAEKCKGDVDRTRFIHEHLEIAIL